MLRVASSRLLPKLQKGLRPLSTSPAQLYEYILTERRGETSNVGLVQLNRPKALNALCHGLMEEVSVALEEMNNDAGVDAIVITGVSVCIIIILKCFYTCRQ